MTSSSPERHFDHDDVAVLQKRLAEWFGAPGGGLRPEPFVLTRGDDELAVHVFAEKGRADCFMLLLKERTPRRPAEALRRLGLTEREAEVLFWIAQGKTNPEIATILCAAPNTIKKHAHNILEKLGVETRTAAARTALETLGLSA